MNTSAPSGRAEDLHVVRQGEGRRIVALHGFTQNANCWGSFGERVATGHEALFVDLPGHGLSRHDNADLWSAAELVANVGGRGIYLGYSMGGRVALHVALAHPELVERLVLIGATPGLRSPSERKQRVATDEALAKRLETNGVEAFLDYWLDLPLFAGLTEAQSCRPARLTNRIEGLAESLRRTGTGTQDDLWARLAEITCPVLLLTGARDEKFTELALEMKPRFGDGRSAVHTAIDSGHSVHLEQPTSTYLQLREWLAATERQSIEPGGSRG